MGRRIKLSIPRLSVILILGTAGVIGTSSFRAWRIDSNESAARTFLKRLFSSQWLIQSKAWIDCNDDTTGEYGFIGEMSGATPLRSTGLPITTPVLAEADMEYVGEGIYRR